VVTVRVVKLDVEAPGAAPSSAADSLAAPPTPPLVIVTWRDAFFDFDKTTADEFRADYLVNTVGFLVSDGPTFVSLAQEVLPDDEGFRAVTHIPRAVVERIVPLSQEDATVHAAE
jgi:hypothetical protein